ncbi:MAG: MFS transporter [Nitrososphaeria archaeon]|nr:MFS transporter [Nitrososphaeria archaeon]
MKKAILANSITSALVVTSTQAVNALMSLFAMQYFNASKSDLGYLFTLFFLTSAFSKILSGLFISQKYLKYIFLLGIFFIATSIVMYDVVPSLELLFIFRIVHGIGFAFTNTACLTLASFIVEDSLKSYSVSMVTAFNAIGLILGPLLGTLGTFFFDIPMTFVIVSLIVVVSFIFAFYASKNVELKAGDAKLHKITVNDFLFLKEKWFIVSTFSYFAYALIYGTIISYIPPFVKQKFGLNDYSITTLFLIFFILSLLSRIILVKRNGLEFLKKALTFSLGVSILMFGLISFSNYFEIFILEFALIGLGHGFVYPITALFISKYAPSEKLYMINTVYFTSFDFGNATGPFIASLLLIFLPFNLVFLGTSIISLTLFFPIILYIKHL